jgi:hypothetical protein
MHRMSFEIGRPETSGPRKELYWPGLILLAVAVSLAWELEPLLAGMLTP